MTLDPLATTDDLEVRLGRALTAEETNRALALLGDASAKVRNFTGQTYSTDTTTEVLEVHNGLVTLLQRPVVSVTSVTDMYGEVVDGWTLTDAVIDLTAAGTNCTTVVGTVTVVYVHGGDVPDLEVGIVCNMALRSLGIDPLTSGYTSEGIDGYNYSIGSAAASTSMLPAERDDLAGRQVPRLPLRML